MNNTSATLDRDDTAISDPGPSDPGTPGHGRHARPSRARRWLIGSGAVVVAGAAVVAGLMASTSHTTAQPAAHPAGTVQTANPAVPSRAEHPGRQPGRPVRPRSRRRHLGRVVKHVVNRAVSRVAEMMGCRSDVPAAASEGTGDRPPRCPPTSRQASDSDAAPADAAASERPDGDLGRCAEQPVDLRVQPAQRE